MREPETHGVQPSLSPDGTDAAPPLSVVIPTLDEARSIEPLLEDIARALDPLGVPYEVLVIDGGSRDDTRERAAARGARVIRADGRPYGEVLRMGLAAARGQFVATMDADFSHDPTDLARLWAVREQADLIIASRYIPGGGARTTRYRVWLSRLLNLVFASLLRLPVRDCSSGFRLYRRSVLASLALRARDFDVQEEILVALHRAGRRIVEIPFHYRPRRWGKSHARLVRCGLAYAATLWRLWRKRS